jgi:hypothetical protein
MLIVRQRFGQGQHLGAPTGHQLPSQVGFAALAWRGPSSASTGARARAACRAASREGRGSVVPA